MKDYMILGFVIINLKINKKTGRNLSSSLF